jgi:hypothetical protein
MSRPSFFSELFAFLKENKKWWLIPILLVFGFLGGILLIAQTAPAAAPFIYTLF